MVGYTILASAIGIGLASAFAVGVVGLQRRLEADDDEVHLNLVLIRALAVAFCLGCLVLAHRLVPPVETISGSLPAVADAVGTALVTALSFTVAAMIGPASIDRQFRPAIGEVDGVEISDRTRRQRRKRWAVAPTLFAGLFAIELATADAVPYGTLWLLVGGGVLAVGYYRVRSRIDPRNPRTRARVRDATADERATIERCFGEFDRTSGPSYVFTADDGARPLFVTNAPGEPDPEIWIEAAFLEDRTETELGVLLVQADERARSHEAAYAHLFAACLGVGVLAVGWLLAAVQSIPLALVAGVLAFAGCSLANRRQEGATFRADDLVSERFGTATVADVYKEYGHHLEGPLSVELSRRLERLEERGTGASSDDSAHGSSVARDGD